VKGVGQEVVTLVFAAKICTVALAKFVYAPVVAVCFTTVIIPIAWTEEILSPGLTRTALQFGLARTVSWVAAKVVAQVLTALLVWMAKTKGVGWPQITCVLATFKTAVAWTAVKLVILPAVSWAAEWWTLANTVEGVGFPSIAIVGTALNSWVALAKVVGSPWVIRTALSLAQAVEAHQELDFSELNFLSFVVVEWKLELGGYDLGLKDSRRVSESRIELRVHFWELDPSIQITVKVEGSDQRGVTPWAIVGSSVRQTIDDDVALECDKYFSVVGKCIPLVPCLSASA
jgi:hypothetical protein